MAIHFDDEDTRKAVEVKTESGVERLFLFRGKEAVKGTVVVTPNAGKKVEHTGVKIELLGQIGAYCSSCSVVIGALV